MDIQLQDLIDKIKSDGVAAAEEKERAIIGDAEQRAAKIISDAEEKASSIIKDAREETARVEKASEDAIRQAARNLIISFRSSVTSELSALLSGEVKSVLESAEQLRVIIPCVVEAMAEKPDEGDLAVLLSPADLASLEGDLKALLKARIANGLVLRAEDSLKSGFRVSGRGGDYFYDFSVDEITALFSAYLNPRVAGIMRQAAESLRCDQAAGGAAGAPGAGGDASGPRGKTGRKAEGEQ